jgi:hypothetical protein
MMLKMLMSARAICMVLWLVCTFRSSRASKIGLCQVELDCDIDSDCQDGLLCADAHKKELEAAGHDPRKANCPYSSTGKKKSYLEVCFDPKILDKKTGGAGGGKNGQKTTSRVNVNFF